jgi:hypothetical protein
VPPVWKELTSTSVSEKVRNSSWLLPPPRRPVRTALFRCLPDAHASRSWGLAFVSRALTCRSVISTLPAETPPPGVGGVGCVSPHDQLRTSISPLCLLSVLSPEIPSILRK